MRRRYRRELFQARINKIKSTMPHCCIGVDVIVGFPGETEEDFMDTYHFLKDLDISYLHVFTYSERANTPAAEMGLPIDMHTRRERNKMLRILSEKKKTAFYKSQVGRIRRILVEAKMVDGFITGHTDNYIQVKLPENEIKVNQVIPVQLGNYSEGFLTGEKMLSESF